MKVIGLDLVVNEVVEEYRKKGMDFEKVYEHVDWDFNDEILLKKGLKERQGRWIRNGKGFSFCSAILMTSLPFLGGQDRKITNL